MNPTALSLEHTLSLLLTAPLTAIIVLQNGDIGEIGDIRQQQHYIKSSLRSDRCKHQEEDDAELKAQLSHHLQRAAETASKKGAYSWVTALPVAAQLLSKKVHFGTHSASATTGDQLTLPEQVYVVLFSPQNMPSHVQLEESPSSNIMRSLTSRPTFSLKYAMMFV